MSEPVHRSRATWAIPIVVYVAAAAVYILLGSLHEIPLIFPDELTYGHLARSLASGEGFSWYGSDESWPMALYIYTLVPSWLLASGESAYQVAKATGALLACTVVFPVWLLAVRLLTPARAAVPAVLTVAGTWMLTTAGLLTENLALPLATAALAATVLGLRDQSLRWSLAAVVFAALATGARAQMGIVFVVMLAAVLLDGALAENQRARLERNRVFLITLGVLVFAGVVVFASGSTSTLGVYADVTERAPSIGDVVTAAGEQWIALAVMSGVLPLAALVVLAAQPSAWHDRDLGALLCVGVPAVVIFILESAYFDAGVPGLDWSIERYVEYVVPLLLVIFIVAVDRQRLPWRWFAAGSAAVALSLLAAPDVRQAVEQRATYATSNLIEGVLGLTSGPALVVAALIVAGLATALLVRTSGSRTVYGVGALMLVVLVVQAQWAWRFQIDFTQQIRAQYPADLSWVNANARGPVTRLFAYQNSYLFQRIELFNDDVKQSLVPARQGPERPPLGRSCVWGVDESGAVQVAPGCGKVRRRIWNDDSYVQMSFHGGRTLARDAMLGQVISVPEAPRLRSVIRMPCQRAVLTLGKDNTPRGIPEDLACPPDMTVSLWVDDPGELELTFQGGTRAQTVAYENRKWSIPPGRRTTVRIPVEPGASSITLQTGWERSAGTELVDAAFVSDTERASLL